MRTRFWLLPLFAVACSNYGVEEPEPAPDGTLIDDRSVYRQDTAEVLMVTITAPDPMAFAAVNRDEPKAKADIVFKEGEFGKNTVMPNAVIKVRGATSRLDPQKSFNIKLKEGTWRGHREINLNKHPFDHSRVRNKVAFELFQGIEHFTSLRTQFVRLSINGQDFGLFTQVEEPNEDFLVAHGLDPQGCLYKAKNFEYYPLEPNVLNDPKAMEEMLDQKAPCDIANIKSMLDTLSNPLIDIDEVIQRHFNRDNYITWLAINVVLGNFDTTTQNFFLYARKSSDRWYILPWDYDGSLGWEFQRGEGARARWRAGIANWWPAMLHQRFLKKPSNRDALTARIRELRQTHLTDQKLRSRLDAHRATVRTQVIRAPDLAGLGFEDEMDAPGAAERGWTVEYERIYSMLGFFENEYMSTMSRPMPIFLHEPVIGAQAGFVWDESYQFDGLPLTYDFELSKSPRFPQNSIDVQHLGLRTNSVSLAPLAPGTYYWRVTVRAGSELDAWQAAVDEIYDPGSQTTYLGIREFIVGQPR